MAIQTLDTASLTALADTAARRLAKAAITNLELREALHTTRTLNGVRIGGCEITYLGEGDDRVYTVRAGDHMEVVAEGVAFYETARYLVMLINNGKRPSSQEVRQLVSTNDEYSRARDMAQLHGELLAHYDAVGDDFRASLNEDKLSRDLARMGVLRSRLLQGHHCYY